MRLNLIALAVAVIIAIPAGMIAALRRYTAIDSSIMITASGGVALPNFWVALMLIVLFTGTLGWLPATGFTSWKHYIMPVTVLAITEFAILARLTRGTMLEVLNQDYMNTARSKGSGRADGHHPTRGSQRDAADHHRRWLSIGVPAQRHGRDRDDLRDPWVRAACSTSP